MDMEALVEVMREVIIENHLKGSKRHHKKIKKDTKVDGMKRKIQIEFDRKLVEIEARFSVST